MGRAVGILPPILVLAACASGDTPAVRALVRDSAGIAIVENAAPLAPDSVAMVVDSARVLEIGGSGDARTEFGRVAGTVRLGDGVIVVADGGNSELRFFDSAGAWQRTVGRKGAGPGEFEMIGGLYRLESDSLAVFDINQRRVSVFGADGALKRGMTLSGSLQDGFPSVIGVMGGDLLVRIETFSQSQQSGNRRDTMPILRYPRWATPSLPLGAFPGWELHSEVSTNSAGQIASITNTILPFGWMLWVGISKDRLHVGTADRYEIASHDSTGRITRLVRWVHAPVPVTDADIATVKQQMLAGFRPGAEAQRDRLSETLERMTFHSTKPAYDGFVAGDDGALWVRRYDQPAEDLPARYDVFDRDGQWLGHVTFPPRFTLHHAGPGYALGVWQDPDEVDHVRLYRLRPTP
jgi:hypothetical protein